MEGELLKLKSNADDRKDEILKFLDSFETKVEDTIKLYDAWGDMYEQVSYYVVCKNKIFSAFW